MNDNNPSANIATLYVVATPIGNLQDITLRAINILKNVDIILAEDTRQSRKLLEHHGIFKQLKSYHEHNEYARTEEILGLLKAGKDCALISDAGTPLISDPGYRIVRVLRKNEINVVPIPGPSAFVAAICASGLSADKFQFIGFLPSKSSSRKKVLKTTKNYDGTTILYESVHRIIACVGDIYQVFGGEREIVLAKEISKCFEYFFSGNIMELSLWLQENPDKIKGEFVLLIDGVYNESDNESIDVEKTLLTLLDVLPLKQAVKVAGDIIDFKNKNELYKLALELKDK